MGEMAEEGDKNTIIFFFLAKPLNEDIVLENKIRSCEQCKVAFRQA